MSLRPNNDPLNELTGLDKIVEVLTRLVLKFGRAITALQVVGVLLIICLIALVISVGQTAAIRTDMRDLIIRQEALMISQNRSEKALKDTLDKVLETRDRIENVAATTPRVKIGDNGKPRIVIPQLDENKKVVKTQEVEFGLTP